MGCRIFSRNALEDNQPLCLVADADITEQESCKPFANK